MALDTMRVAAVAPRPTTEPGAVGTVQLALVEGFELTNNGHEVLLPVAAQRLLAFLALHDRPLLRLHVATVLWPDTSERRSSANLRSTLWRLQRPGCPVVQATAKHLRLAPGVLVDIRELTRLANELVAGSIDMGAVDYAKLYRRGELLGDWYEDWLMIERERFRQLRVHALEQLCARLIAVGRFGEAVQAGLAAVEAEPLRESARRVLIRTHLAEGNGAEALTQYHVYKELLRRELGLKPSPEIEELVARLMI